MPAELFICFYITNYIGTEGEDLSTIALEMGR